MTFIIHCTKRSFLRIRPHLLKKSLMEKLIFCAVIGTFQSHCKSEHNQVKRNKITQDMCANLTVFVLFTK